MKKLFLSSLFYLLCQNSHALSLGYDFAQNGSFENNFSANIHQYIDIDIYALDAGSAPDGLVGMGFRLEFDNTQFVFITATLISSNWDVDAVNNRGLGFAEMAGSSFNAFSGNVLLGHVKLKTLGAGLSVFNLFDFDKGGSIADFVSENNAELDSTMAFPYTASLSVSPPDVPTPPPLAFLLLGFALAGLRKMYSGKHHE